MTRKTLTLGNTAPSKSSNVFLVHNMSGVKALQYWLKDKQYNSFRNHKDKNNHSMFGLIQDDAIDKLPHQEGFKQHRRGIVIILNEALYDVVALNIAKQMKPDDYYGRSIKQSLVETYKLHIEVSKNNWFNEVKL